ncbi:hypothetical protein niasHT_019248 [Heterodera trifolii]|uniref:ATP-dependent DNA helicase n=1 Tax=Heterodera trifolii TaxID=157864 RepID=A0ABD2L0Z7_9BILA
MQNTEFRGVIRFHLHEQHHQRRQQQSSPSMTTTGALATKCMRASSMDTVAQVVDALVAKFHGEADTMHMTATTPAIASYSLWEVHDDDDNGTSDISEPHMDVDERPLLVQLGWCCHNNGIASGNKERSDGSERCVLPPPMHNGRFVLRRQLPKGRSVGSGTLMIVQFKKVRRANKRHVESRASGLGHQNRPIVPKLSWGDTAEDGQDGTAAIDRRLSVDNASSSSYRNKLPASMVAAAQQLESKQSKSLAALSLLDTLMMSLPSPPRCDGTSVVAELQHRNRHLPQQQGQPTRHAAARTSSHAPFGSCYCPDNLTHLHHPTDWADLKTFNDHQLFNFVEAAKAHGLFVDNILWKNTIVEAFETKKSARQCIRWLAVFFATANLSNPSELLDEIIQMPNNWLVNTKVAGSSIGERRQYVLRALEWFLRAHGIEIDGKKLEFDCKINRLFMVTGEEIDHISQINGFTFLPTATTGIDAELLYEGQTVHKRICRRKHVNSSTPLNIDYDSRFAELLRRTHGILIDEISMQHKDVLEYVDRLLRSVAPTDYLRRIPFAGKVIVLGGDWKQLAPVVPGGGHLDQLNASVKNSHIFNQFVTRKLRANHRLKAGQDSYRRFLLRVGTGKANTIDHRVQLNASMCVETREEQLLDFVFPPEMLHDPLQHTDQFGGSAILSPLNSETFQLNNIIMDRIVGDERVYVGTTQPIHDKTADTELLNIAAEVDCENLCRMTPHGVPEHRLRIKVGAIIMIITNISIADGLCNGTRVQILPGPKGKLSKYII